MVGLAKSNKSSAVAEMSDRFATIDMGRKVGSVVLLSLGPHLIQCRLGRGLPAYHVASWSIQPFGHNTPTSQRDRTDRQRSDSTGWTVLQTVVQTHNPCDTEICQSNPKMAVWEQNNLLRANFRNSSRFSRAQRLTFFSRILCRSILLQRNESSLYPLQLQNHAPFSPPFCAPLAQGAKILTPEIWVRRT